MLRQNKILRSLALAGWVAWSGIAMAQNNAVMDLRQIYQAALAQDATIRASRAAADAGRERLPQARAGLMPSVSASVGRNNNNLDTTTPQYFGYTDHHQ